MTEIPPKIYLNSLSENDRKSRDTSTLVNDQDDEFDNIKLTNLDCNTVKRNPKIIFVVTLNLTKH